MRTVRTVLIEWVHSLDVATRMASQYSDDNVNYGDEVARNATKLWEK
jgi:hypothetical protein